MSLTPFNKISKSYRTLRSSIYNSNSNSKDTSAAGSLTGSGQQARKTAGSAAKALRSNIMAGTNRPASTATTSSATATAVQSDRLSAEAVKGKATAALTKEYVSALEAQAQQDAKLGSYGYGGKAAELRAAQMAKYVSPDREAATAQVTRLMADSAAGSAGTRSVSLQGLPYTARISSGRLGLTAEIFDENGEKFASYDPKGGWKSVTTRAESQFQTASSSLYGEAYRTARAALTGAARSAVPGLDLRG